MKGTYLLIIFLNKHVFINIGALGKIRFPKGFYVYVGSALGQSGSNTLENRVKRHLSSTKKLHWHIDYLLNAKSASFFRLYLIPSCIKLECLIADEIKLLSNGFIKKFGCSDCLCESHLFYFREFKDFRQEN
jgi:Uri superfamily endonuclease